MRTHCAWTYQGVRGSSPSRRCPVTPTASTASEDVDMGTPGSRLLTLHDVAHLREPAAVLAGDHVLDVHHEPVKGLRARAVRALVPGFLQVLEVARCVAVARREIIGAAEGAVGRE